MTGISGIGRGRPCAPVTYRVRNPAGNAVYTTSNIVCAMSQADFLGYGHFVTVEYVIRQERNTPPAASQTPSDTPDTPDRWLRLEPV